MDFIVDMYSFWFQFVNPWSPNAFQPAPVIQVLMVIIWLLFAHMGGLIACGKAKIDIRVRPRPWQYWAGAIGVFVLAPPLFVIVIGVVMMLTHKEQKL